MMKRIKAKIDSLVRLRKDIFLLRFSSGYLAKKAVPGQFIHIKTGSPQLLLRRPFSIHKIDKEKIYILFRVRGKGTGILSQRSKGSFLDMVGPLGKGFDYCSAPSGRQDILVAGGMGVAPLVFLAQKLAQGTEMQSHKETRLILLGGATKNDIIGRGELKKLGFKVLVATEDGSLGFKGLVTDLLKDVLVHRPSSIIHRVYGCGPNQMVSGLSKILRNHPGVKCQVSFEQFMGCGIGVCRACVIKTRKGYKRICKEGPVFDIKDIFKRSS